MCDICLKSSPKTAFGTDAINCSMRDVQPNNYIQLCSNMSFTAGFHDDALVVNYLEEVMGQTRLRW